MKKRARICFYIFVVCAFFALGILGYFVFNSSNDNVMVGSKKFVTFNEVPNASVYALSVKSLDNMDTNTYQAFYKITKSETENKNEYAVNTEVRIDDKKVAEESYTQQNISEKEDKIDCVIKNYQVTFFDELGNSGEVITFEDQMLNDVNKNIVCCIVSEYFETVFTCDGTYSVVCNAYNENGDLLEDSQVELTYDYEAYYLRDFERRPAFYMNGQMIDYVVDDKDEFKEFVWHAILYRENDINFYCNTDEINESNINSLTIQAINDYPEYDGLYDANSYASLNKSIGKLFNFQYYLDFNFTKNFETLESLDAEAYTSALDELHKKNEKFNVDYVKKSESSEERTFPIDSAEKEVLVYNTEQLFMVVQYGAKPVFLDEDDEDYKEEYAIVKTVYNNAREELKKINNNDSLSDYVKALNIYRYLCENVVYDYVTYEYMSIKNDFSVFTFGSFNCFYLEGVFLDLENQYAVCDGLAKAYTLLCRIEGLSCVKVNGKVNGENHAWNKLGLEDVNTNELMWLYVDPTWGVGTDKETKEEYLTHSYFLFQNNDRLNREQRRVEFESEIDTSNEASFDYYEHTYYEFTDDEEVVHSENCKVVSDEELEDVFDFVKYKLNYKKENSLEESYTIEIEFSTFYSKNPYSKIYSLLYSRDEVEDSFLTEFSFENGTKMEYYKITQSKDIVLFRFYK